jgi:molecular chaperone GrpE
MPTPQPLRFRQRKGHLPALKHPPEQREGESDLTEEAVKDSEREDEQPEQTVERLQKQLEDAIAQKKESEKKAADYLDKLQRLQADMENIRKITKRQVETVTSQASERLVVKLLPSLDALRQAVKIASSSEPLPQDEIAVGLRMLQEQLIQVLETEGLQEIPAEGKPLDPEVHEVVSYVETDAKPENTVLEEIRKGYTLNGKVIRPSLVVVSKKPKDKEGAEGKTG